MILLSNSNCGISLQSSPEHRASDDRNSVNCLCRQFGYSAEEPPRSFAENAMLPEGSARRKEREKERRKRRVRE